MRFLIAHDVPFYILLNVALYFLPEYRLPLWRDTREVTAAWFFFPSLVYLITASAEQQPVEVYLVYSAQVRASDVFPCMQIHAIPNRTAKRTGSWYVLPRGEEGGRYGTELQPQATSLLVVRGTQKRGHLERLPTKLNSTLSSTEQGISEAVFSHSKWWFTPEQGMLIARKKSPWHPTPIRGWMKLSQARGLCPNHCTGKWDYGQAPLVIALTRAWYSNRCELLAKWLRSAEQCFAHTILFLLPSLFQGFSWLKD